MFWLVFIIFLLCSLLIGGALVVLMLYSIIKGIETLLEVFLPDWLRKHKE